MKMRSKVLTALIIAVLLILGGCVLIYEPEQKIVVLSPGESQTFNVELGSEDWKVTWNLDDQRVATGLTYTYTAEENPGTEMISHRLEVLSVIRPVLRWHPAFWQPWPGPLWEIRVLGAEGPAPCYLDGDGDGFGGVDKIVQSANPPANCVADHTDCIDYDETINPGAVEICNDRDDNCNGVIDEGC